MKLLPYEIWKDIPGYEGLYQASTMGNIRSLNHLVKNNGKSRNVKPYKLSRGRLLTPGISNKRYYAVNLCKNGERKMRRVAALVMLTFVGPRPLGMVINHIDENTFNNSISNLEYCTQSYNQTCGTVNTRRSKKLSRPVVQLTTSGEIVRIWPSQEEIERRTNYCQPIISSCCNGRLKTAYGYKWNYYEKGK